MLIVFLGHFASVWSRQVHPNGSPAFFLRLMDADATFGSSLFMMLSAFFAYGSLRRGNKSFGAFLRGRFWRLYPLYLIMIAVYIVGSLVFPKMSKLPGDRHQVLIFLVETLLLLPGILHIRPLIDVAWTLSFLILFYFIEGAMARAFRSVSVPRASRIVFLGTAAMLWAQVGDLTLWWEPRTAIFWTGMVLSEIVEWMSEQHQQSAIRLVLPAVSVAILGVCLRTHLLLTKPPVPVVSLLVWCFVITSVTLSALLWVCYFGPAWWKSLLSGTQLSRMGAASYSFYLTHGLAIKVFKYGVIPALGAAAADARVFWACQVAGLALSVVIARAVHERIENPISRLVPWPSTAQPSAFGFPASSS